MGSSTSKIKGGAKGSLAGNMGLPKTYGDTKIVILARDPMWFYSYWEVSPDAFGKLRKELGDQTFNSSRWTLRVYDITDIKFNGKNAHRHFDIIINPAADNWYVNVGEVNRVWCVDLGIITPDGRFIVIARSNVLAMPRQGISPITDEQWAMLQQEFEKLLKLSGVDQIGRSSFDITKLMRERWEEIVSISLPSSHIGASSWKRFPGEELHKDFWLRADTELIVYGATEPDAKLTVQKKVVPLRPDGSFSLRFYLPDGTQEYPIEATSNDGTMKRQITFVVRRDTK
ncbi:MAG: DUF4912 domain-containing protein [Endomicrobiales bacterium]|nr:DUF4912 domain-containing protein [Endomicrobiales bacterium]